MMYMTIRGTLSRSASSKNAGVTDDRNHKSQRPRKTAAVGPPRGTKLLFWFRDLQYLLSIIPDLGIIRQVEEVCWPFFAR